MKDEKFTLALLNTLLQLLPFSYVFLSICQSFCLPVPSFGITVIERIVLKRAENSFILKGERFNWLWY